MTITTDSREDFIFYLKTNNYSSKTLSILNSSLDNLSKFLESNSLETYREYLIDTYAPSTVNIRIWAVNKYMKFSNINYSFKSVPNTRIKTLEKVISNRNYIKLRDYFYENNFEMYLAIKTMVGTGVRPSELFKIKVSDVKKGYADLYSKRSKQRRIYFPKELQTELLTYKTNSSEKLFTFTMNQLRYALRKGTCLGISKDVLHPYTFRHFFGKQFIKKNKNLTLLADLMGHESLETTRIYTRLTREEQQREVNRIVKWM